MDSIYEECSAISDVDGTLVKLLSNSLKDLQLGEKSVSENSISLSSPDEATDNHLLSMFLYKITENTFERNQGMRIQNSKTLKYPPLSLSLFYMITPNPDLKDQKSSHILLGKILQVFSSNPVLRDPNLQGMLAGGELKLIFHQLSFDDLNKLWNTVSRSKPYRASLFYEITPVRIESSESVDVSRVKETKVQIFS